jgi:hypothetical protein
MREFMNSSYCGWSVENFVESLTTSSTAGSTMTWRQYRDLFIARDLSQMALEIIGGMNAGL